MITQFNGWLTGPDPDPAQASLQLWEGGTLSLLGQADPSLALADSMTLTMQDIVRGSTVNLLLEHASNTAGQLQKNAAISLQQDGSLSRRGRQGGFLQPRQHPQAAGSALSIWYKTQAVLQNCCGRAQIACICYCWQLCSEHLLGSQ